MRRVHGHFAFGLVAAAFGVVAVGEVLRLRQAQHINTAIAQWSAQTAPSAAASEVGAPADVVSASTRPKSAPTGSTQPEAHLAHAVALSKVDYDGALAAYKVTIQSGREDLRRIALYDLGNLHLRHALQVGPSDEGQSLPLIELAKQSYRDLLRRDPNDWDVRYNLERTLRLAPEDDDNDEDAGPPSANEHERSTIADPRMDLP